MWSELRVAYAKLLAEFADHKDGNLVMRTTKEELYDMSGTKMSSRGAASA